MTQTVEYRDDATIITLTGKLAQEEAIALESKVTEEIAAGHTKIVIDLNALNFISSDGLSSLLEIRLRLQHKEGYIRLVCPSELVYQVFHRTKLNKIFQIYDSFEQAVHPETK